MSSIEQDPEKLLLIIKMGVKMRAAQTRYFKGRSREELLASKKAEGEFDKAAAAALGPLALVQP